MRIMLVPNSYPPPYGGLEVAVATLAKVLTSRGHCVSVVAGSSTFWPHVLQRRPFPVRRTPFWLPRFAFQRRLAVPLAIRTLLSPVAAVLSFVILRREIARFRPNVVNVHYLAENALFALWVARLRGVPLIVSIHGHDIQGVGNRGKLAARFTRTVLRRADFVTANSVDTLEKVKNQASEIVSRSIVIGNAISLEFADALATQQESDNIGVLPAKFVLCVTNYARKKGVDVLLRAMQILRQDSDLELVIAGDGECRAELAKLAVSLDLCNVVHFLGQVPHIGLARIYRRAKIVAIPSRLESFGIVTLEAMAAGKPVVASCVGGLREIIQDRVTGLLVPVDDPSSLAEALLSLERDPDLGVRLGEAGRMEVLSRWGPENMAKGYEQAYALALEGRGKEGRP